MGGGLSTFQNEQENVNNVITQNSSNICVTQCTNSNNTTDIILNNDTVKGDWNITNACAVFGSSCVLKSALTDSLTNTLSQTQASTIKDEQDIFTIFSNLTSAGDSISQDEYQSVSNQVTQNLNSLCKNTSSTVSNAFIFDATDSTITLNLNYSNVSSVSKTYCVSSNMASNYVVNDLTQSQKASLTRQSCTGSICSMIVMVIIVIGAVIGIIAIGRVVERKKKKGPTPTPTPSPTPTPAAKKPAPTTTAAPVKKPAPPAPAKKPAPPAPAKKPAPPAPAKKPAPPAPVKKPAPPAPVKNQLHQLRLKNQLRYHLQNLR